MENLANQPLVLIFESSNKSGFGGGQRVSLSIIDMLKNSYDVLVVDSKKYSTFKEMILRREIDIIEIFLPGKIQNKKVSSFNISSLEVVLFCFLFPVNLFLLYKRLFFLKKKHNKIIIYIATNKLLYHAFFLRFLLGIRYIYHAHTIDSKKSFFFKLLHFPLKFASKIICVSAIVQESYTGYKSVKIYNAIISKRQSEARSIDNKSTINVAFVGSLVKIKGADIFVKSFEFLKSQQKVNYLLYGAGSEIDYLRRISNNNTSISFKGFNSNIESEYKNIDVLVLPTIVPEAAPLVVAEAFANGIPVITTNVGGQAEIVNDQVGLLVPTRSPEAIALAIDSLVNNGELYKRLSFNSIKYSHKFDFSSYREEIINIFQKICNER